MNASNNCKIDLKASVFETLRSSSEEKLGIIRSLASCESYKGTIIKDAFNKVYPYQFRRVCVDNLNHAKLQFENEPCFLTYVILSKMVRMKIYQIA